MRARLLAVLAVALLPLWAGCVDPCASGTSAAQARLGWVAEYGQDPVIVAFQAEGWDVTRLPDGNGVLARRAHNDTVMVRASVLDEGKPGAPAVRAYFYADGTKVSSVDEAEAILGIYVEPMRQRLVALMGEPATAVYVGGNAC